MFSYQTKRVLWLIVKTRVTVKRKASPAAGHVRWNPDHWCGVATWGSERGINSLLRLLPLFTSEQCDTYPTGEILTETEHLLMSGNFSASASWCDKSPKHCNNNNKHSPLSPHHNCENMPSKSIPTIVHNFNSLGKYTKIRYNLVVVGLMWRDSAQFCQLSPLSSLSLTPFPWSCTKALTQPDSYWTLEGIQRSK